MRRLVLCAGLLALFQPSPARARPLPWSFTLTPAYAITYVDDRTAQGGGGALDVSLALTDALSVELTGALAWQAAPSTKTELAGTLAGYAAIAGIRYTLDAIRLQPSFDLGLGAVGLRGSPGFGDPAGRVLKPVDAFALALGFSVDWLFTRHVAVGAEVRYHVLLTDLDRVPMFLYVGPRVTFTVGN